MKIHKFPHPALFTPCTEVTDFGPKLKENLDKMWDIMVAVQGMGLSANQVGLFDRYFVMQGHFGQKIYVVNPIIRNKSQELSPLVEGCLSAPGDFLNLKRAEVVYLDYQDETGKPISKIFTSYFSICVQHEIDHLDGKSFLESEVLDKKTRKKLAKKWGIL